MRACVCVCVCVCVCGSVCVSVCLCVYTLTGKEAETKPFQRCAHLVAKYVLLSFSTYESFTAYSCAMIYKKYSTENYSSHMHTLCIFVCFPALLTSWRTQTQHSSPVCSVCKVQCVFFLSLWPPLSSRLLFFFQLINLF